MLDMNFDRTHTHNQLVGDLAVGQALCKQLQHLALTWGEPYWRLFRLMGRFIGQVPKYANHQLFIQNRLPMQDAPYSADEFTLRYVLKHITGNPCLEGFEEINTSANTAKVPPRRS